jgi:hypothetical protein
MRKTLFERCSKDLKSGCWLWSGKVNDRGYGRLHIAGKDIYAHRAAWEQSRRQRIPEGKIICHHCDTPLCINPDHLYLGTHADNHRDMDERGRRVPPPRNDLRGEKSWAHKLTEQQVLEIRASPDLQRVLAERYGVRQNTISRIKTGRRWAHAEGPIKEPWKRD